MSVVLKVVSLLAFHICDETNSTAEALTLFFDIAMLFGGRKHHIKFYSFLSVFMVIRNYFVETPLIYCNF